MSSASDQIQMNHNDPNKFRNNTNTSIDDLPDGVLAEIVCRLPCYKFVFRCKGVSKRWCTFVSDPQFIERFVRLQSDRKIPIIRTLLNFKAEEFRFTMTVEEEEFLTTMNTKAEEFLAAVTTKGEELLPTEAVLIATKTKTLLNRMARKVEKSLTRTPSKPLTPLFERLMSCHSMESEPFVVATCNDLVLCCASEFDQRDYFICNPWTIQWVPLPPPPRVYRQVAVGFIFDDVDNAQQSCRCKVVRIPGATYQSSFNLKVEIFSSETGKWRESIVSFTQKIYFDCGGVVDPNTSYSYNGMLYWNSPTGYWENCFIGFDPFMINTTRSSDGIDHYKGRIIRFGDRPDYESIVCVGVYGGCLRFITEMNLVSCTLHAWELEEEHDERAVDRYDNLILKCSKYSLDTQMFDGTEPMSLLCLWSIFDPNDEDILYLRHDNAGNFKCNFRTREWSKMQIHRLNDNDSIVWFQLITLPWWPTPVPRLSQDQHGNIPMEQASKQLDSSFRGSFSKKICRSNRTEPL